MCVAIVLLWEGARNIWLHSINLGLNFDVSSQTNRNSQPTHKNVNTIKKQIPQIRRESHPRNLWLNGLESPFCGKLSDGSTCAWGHRAFWWIQGPKHIVWVHSAGFCNFFCCFCSILLRLLQILATCALHTIFYREQSESQGLEFINGSKETIKK